VDITNSNNYGFPHSPYRFSDDPRPYGNVPLAVTFHTPSGNETYDLHIGRNDSGRAFVRWKTPAHEVSPRTMTVTVNKPAGIIIPPVTFMVTELPESRPPDPEARDRFNSFRHPRVNLAMDYDDTVATWEENELNGWLSDWSRLLYIGVYETGKQPAWIASGAPGSHPFVDRWTTISRGGMANAAVYGTKQRRDGDGNPLYAPDGSPLLETDYSNLIEPARYHYYAAVDRGHWLHRKTTQSASISGSMTISADEKVPTARDGGKTIRSGYGFNVVAEFATTNPARCTNIQNVQTFFPEFNFKEGFGRGGIRAMYPLDGIYWRWLERMPEGSGRFEFHENPWSTYGQRVHFTPVWFPDTRHADEFDTVIADAHDAWTPGGELRLSLSDGIRIHGSVFDDWHVAPGW
jgi:hypothetical protein